MGRFTLVLLAIVALLVALAGCETESAPEADFAASQTMGSVPVTIQFSDLSTGHVGAWAWDFDGDQLVDSTDQHPKYTYTEPGIYTVTLRVHGGGGVDLATKENYIVVSPPAETIDSVTPVSGKNGQTLDIVIRGSGFTGVESVSFGNEVTVNSFTVVSPSQINTNITIDIYAAPAPRDVTVVTSTISSRLTDGFMIVLPQSVALTGVSPNSGDLASTLDVAITGANFDVITVVDFGEGITVNNYDIENPSQLNANISIAVDTPTTYRDVIVGNPAGNTTLSNAFRINTPLPPVVTDISPGFASRGETVEIAITGSRFGATRSVVFRSGIGVIVNSFNVDSSTQITASISIAGDALIGPRDCSVTTPGGIGTLTQGFEVVGISPSFGSQRETLDVVVNGTGFEDVSAVSFGEAVHVNGFTVDSQTRITASISIAVNAAPGPREILVTTSTGEKHAGSFTVASPTCTANFLGTPTTGNGVTTVQFTDKSTGNINSWEWNLNGDGNIDSNVKNPSYTYSKNNNYTVTLTVTGPFCRDTLTKTDYIRISGCST